MTTPTTTPNSQLQAQLDGEQFYFTGRPCKQGHISHRYTSNGHCIECSKKYDREWRRDNREYLKKYRAEYNLTRRR